MRFFLEILNLINRRFNLLKISLFTITFISYALLLNWKFAILLMLSVGWHESGHVWAMRKVSVDTRGFYFIPFFGGVAIGGNNYRSYADRIIVLIMGPMWGALLAMATLIVYWITGNEILGAAAYWQALMNLFNLIPVSPLDGGQIFKSIFTSISRKAGNIFSIVSIIVFTVAAIKFCPAIVFVTVLAVFNFIAEVKTNIVDDWRKLSRNEIYITLITYGIVTSLLAATISSTKQSLDLLLK